MDAERYIKNPTKCPYCGSRELDAGHFQVDMGNGTTAIVEVTCDACEKEWTEGWTLTSVTESDDIIDGSGKRR